MAGRILKWVGVVVVLAALGGLAGGGWYYSDLLREDGLLAKPPEPPTYDLEVLAVADDTVTLPRTEDTLRPGVWGLEWRDGYGQLGELVGGSTDQITRAFTPVEGRPEPGTRARIDGYAFPGDPSAVGLAFREVTYPGPLGDYPAWWVEGPRDTWAIVVHGRGAERREALRTLPSLAEAGLPALVITYRNDPDAPAGPDGLYRFGDTEWRDLEAAVRWARTQGAADVVLVGYSMGGGVVAAFLQRSSLAPLVRGVILDAPMLDFGATVDAEAARRGIPRFFTELAKSISALRFGVSWSGWNYLNRADRLEVPVLLFHGTADRTVPVETSRALAQARPDLVTYREVEGAGHVHAWNHDPGTYRQAVKEFLGSLRQQDQEPPAADQATATGPAIV